MASAPVALLGSILLGSSSPAPAGDFCGICVGSGSSFTASPINSTVTFVATEFVLAPGACTWENSGADLDCVPHELEGCSYSNTGNWVRGTPPFEEYVTVTATAQPDCGSSGTGTDHTIAGDLTVSITCGPCLE